MAQIVTITNPLTGQPAQVDQLDHTAQEIDDAIARALPGGAIDLEKAPSGFGGFGEVQSKIDINNNETAFNSAIDGLLSRMKDGASMQIRFANYPVYGDDGAIFSGFLFKSSNNYVVLRGTNYVGGSIQKAKSGGTWKPWEWVNPPMELGVEYRTTERYQGKPVYVKMVDFGALPNKTTKRVDPNITNFSKLVDMRIIIAVSDGSYHINTSFGGDTPVTINNRSWFKLSTGGISIKTVIDQSADSAIVTLRYTKTTD